MEIIVYIILSILAARLLFLLVTFTGLLVLSDETPLGLYCKRVWVSIDQQLNATFYPILNPFFQIDGFGYPDETLSSVFGKYSKQCIWCYRICRILNWIDKAHCENSIETDEGKKGG